MKPNHLLLPAVLVAGVVVAQGPITNMPLRGMMPSFPTGFVMTNSPTRIQKKEAGLPVVMNRFQRPVNGVAWWDETEIQRVLGTYLAPGRTLTPPVIDAMSSGNDLLPLVHDGSNFRISQGNVAGWATLYMGLEDNAGTPLGVYGYYFDNPSFPSQLQNGLYLEYQARELDPAATHGPAAMDVSMGLIVDNNGRLQSGMQVVKNRLYFSLTDQSAQALWNALAAPGLTWSNGSPYTPPANINRYDGATIFVAEYDAAGLCVDVKIAEDSSTLLLPPGTEIDALAIGVPQPGVPVGAGQEPLTPGERHYVISTDPALGNEEIHVVATVDHVVMQGGVPVPTRIQDPLRDNNGNSITANGGSIGRVRSMCSQDPVHFFVGGDAFLAPCNYEDPDGNQLMGLSAAMMFGDNQNDSFQLTGVLTGWSAAAENSFFWLAVQMESGPATGFTHYYGPWFRSNTDDAVTFVQKIVVPWTGIGSPPGPYTPGRNSYRMWVYQQGVSSGQESESIRGLVLREM